MLSDELDSLRRAVRFRRQKRVREVRVSPQRRAVMRDVVQGAAVVVVVFVEAALAALVELARRVVQVRQLHHLDLVGFAVGQRVVAVRGRVRRGRGPMVRAPGPPLPRPRGGWCCPRLLGRTTAWGGATTTGG